MTLRRVLTLLTLQNLIIHDKLLMLKTRESVVQSAGNVTFF